ncbi:MAG: hypothetical protein RLZZ142_2645 [Verrucomicrobiota bacterium]
MSRSESEAHFELKQLALQWARAQGYKIAHPEVALPHYRFRLDVAAYRPTHLKLPDPNRGGRLTRKDAIGHTAVFECKAFRSDYRRDARSIPILQSRLEALHQRRLELERLLRLYYPSILNGDSLFQEFHSVDFTRAGHPEYGKLLQQIQRLTSQLHANTKFERLVQWGAANLFYLVAEPDTVPLHEIPPAWGLLVRQNAELILLRKPHFHEVPETERLALLHRIALTATPRRSPSPSQSSPEAEP